MVEVFVTPLETELEHEVQLGQGGVTSDKESTPDKGTDASQDDTQLIDVWMGLLLFHAQSVRRHTPCFKGSPRYLAVSRAPRPPLAPARWFFEDFCGKCRAKRL